MFIYNVFHLLKTEKLNVKYQATTLGCILTLTFILKSYLTIWSPFYDIHNWCILKASLNSIQSVRFTFQLALHGVSSVQYIISVQN